MRFTRRSVGARCGFCLITGLAALLSSACDLSAQFRPTNHEESAQPLGELIYTQKSSLYRNFNYALERKNQRQILTIVQAILDLPDDAFVIDESNQVQSLKTLAFDHLESLSPADLRNYRREREVDAEILLGEAKQSGNARDYFGLLERYYFTESGFKAADWLASRALDRGRFRSAARLWNDLIDSPIHASKTDSGMLFKAAIANRLSGQGERAAELMQRVQASPAGRSLSDRLEAYLASVSSKPPAQASQRLSLPSEWSISLVDQLDPDERRFLDDWRHEHWSEGGYPLFVNRSAVALGGILCVRDYNDLLFANLETGEVRGRYPMFPRLQQIAENAPDSSSLYQPRFRRFSEAPDFREYFTWNTLHGQLSHDESRIYLIEGDESWAKGQQLRPGERFRVRVGERNATSLNDPVPVNSLVAFSVPERSLQGSPPAPVWKIDEQSEDLGKAFFLAPPVNIDGVLYTVAEIEKTIRLIGLDPATGQLIWSQGLAVPQNSLFEDQDRRMRSCAITDAGGLLVVTTQVGVVVGIDPLRRRLQWAYYVGDTDLRRFGGPFGNDLTSYNYLGFPDRPLIDADRVFLLPRQSRHLHCLDLKTGTNQWKIERNGHSNSTEPSDGDEYLGGVAGNTLLVVGSTRTRGLSIADGRELWAIEHPKISGVGVLDENEYLLPLENSRLLRIAIQTGHSRQIEIKGVETQAQLPRSGIEGDRSLSKVPAPLPEFGHLMLVGDRLLSLGLERVRCLVEPAAKLESLQIAARQRPLSPEQRWELASFVPLGQEALREKVLSELSDELKPDDPLGRKVQSDYKEFLFSQLQNNQNPAQEAAISKKLAGLLETDAERIRYLIAQSRGQMRDLNSEGVLDSLKQLSGLHSTDLFVSPDDPHLLVSLGAWNRAIWEWATENLTGPQLDRFESLLQEQINTALASNDADQNGQLLERFPGLPQLDPVRFQLGLQSLERGEYHAAEMLFLTISRRPQPGELRQQATIELARLWTRFGETSEAAALFESNRRPDEPRPSDAFFESIAQLKADPRFDRAWNNLHPALTAPTQVQVLSHPPGPRQSSIRRQYEYFRIFATPHDCNFDLLADRKNAFTESRFSRRNFLDDRLDNHRLKILSRTRGTIDAEIEIPNRNTSTASSEDAVVGHFFPLGSPGQVRGISLIDVADAKPIWTRSFLEPGMSDLLFVGPCNSEYVTFRNRDTLLSVDSRTGHVLWRRNALAPRTGFSNGKMPKLFGDHKVLVRLGDEENQLGVYRSFSGQSVEIPGNISRTGMFDAVGRFAVQVRYADSNSESGIQRRKPSVVVLDMESAEEVWASPYWNNKCFEVVRDRLVVITPEQQLKVLNLKNREEEFSIELTTEECTGVTNLEFFSDATNHYVNIGRINDQNAGIRAARYSQPISNAFLPTVRVEGLLLAIDRQSGKRRWSRMIPACAILETPYERLPFLVSISKLTRQSIPNIQRMQVEALSLEDGSRLAVTDDFVPLDQYTALVHTFYDSQSGRLELHGPMYYAEIRFNPAWERLAQDPKPF